MARKRPPTFEQIKDEYSHLFATMKINPSWASGAARIASRIRENKKRYEEIAKLTGGNIPWQFVGVIHNLESGCDFTKHLHNGDSLRARTRRVPRGHPKKGTPPFTFEESAVDALRIKGYHKIKDWSIERILYELERYNGFGYRMYHPYCLTPYLWSGTQHYTRGKYVSDGKWSATAVSAQGGAAPVLKLLDTQQVKKDSRRLNFFQWVKNVIFGGSLGGVFSWSLLQEVRSFVTDYAGLIVLGTAGLVVLAILYMEYRSDKEIREGRYVPFRLIGEDSDERS